MRRALAVFVLMVVVGVVAFASGATEGAAANDPLRGTWYGGSSNPDNAGYKYQYTFVPTGSDRWYAMADGAYNPDSLGAAVATTWTGEVVRSGSAFTIRMIALTTNDPTEPPSELPLIHVVEGTLTAAVDGSVGIQYHYYAMYDWGKRPFVDEPTQWLVKPGEPPIVEELNRMSMDATIPSLR